MTPSRCDDGAPWEEMEEMASRPISKFELAIDKYLSEHPEAKLNRFEPYELNGKRIDLEVYRLPWELLRYNIRNGRFAAELMEREAQLGRRINPEDSEDAKELEGLLLKDEKQATFLKEDILRVNQLRPGVITRDGAIIDGNRRVAVLKRLYAETGNRAFQYFEAVRLPSTVSAIDLWRIEAGIQISADLKVTYGPVNELLKIKEGIETGLSRNEIALTLSGDNTAEIVTGKLERLQLIESYLIFIGKPNEFSQAERRVEHFIDLQNVMASSGYIRLQESEKLKFLNASFDMIRSGVAHLQIRNLGKILKDSAAFADILTKSSSYISQAANQIKPPTEHQKDMQSTEDSKLVDEILGTTNATESMNVPPQTPNSEDEDNGLDEQQPEGQAVTEVGDLANRKEAYLEMIADGIDQVETRKREGKPAKLLQRAMKAIDLLKGTKADKLRPLTSGLEQLSKSVTELINRTKE